MRGTTEAALRRLAVVLKDSNDAITVLDLNGNIRAWNRGAAKLYGYTEDEALTMNVAAMIPDSRKESTAYIHQIASGEITESFETQRIAKDGKVLDIWITATCLKNDSGIIDSIATTERDITQLKNDLRAKENEVKILRGLLPICASCKEIRDDQGYWHSIESYIHEHSEAEFSHGICPKCLKKLYPRYDPANRKR
jgi:PAS domain S-box-containing protein